MAPQARRHASCGTRCTKSTVISRVRANWLVNYAKRYRAGLRVGTSVTEGTANFLVNRRMNKSQQMRWSRRGADLLLQVRCALYNGVLGSGLGHLFEPVSSPDPQVAKAAWMPPNFLDTPGVEPASSRRAWLAGSQS